MRRRRRPETVAGPTPHELVRGFETTLATRKADAAASADDVARARSEADDILTTSRARAHEVARDRAAEIVAEAREQANRIVGDGDRAAAALTERSERDREADVARILTRVLPGVEVS